MQKYASNDIQKSTDWWANSIIDMQPGKINFRGVPIEQLMESKSFSQMILFMLMGKSHYSKEQLQLFEMAMVMSVDHGPQAPSIAIARMAATCGISLNNVMGSAVNVLGDNHGGAGQACAELFYAIKSEIDSGSSLEHSVEHQYNEYVSNHGKIIPGYGHRFHTPTDPRAKRTLETIEHHKNNGAINGIFKDIALCLETRINQHNTHTHIPLNVDGATAMIFCELEIPPALCRGLFCLSRSVGILAHAWEEMQGGMKNKGPIPREYIPIYRPEEDVADA